MGINVEMKCVVTLSRAFGNGKFYDLFMIKIKRAYEPANRSDGYRVLIDRMWPRGIKKEDLIFDEWVKDLAPSKELRQYFAHESYKWKSFKSLYRKELHTKEAREKLKLLGKRALKGTVTLIYSAKDEEHNNAVVLKDIISRWIAKRTKMN